jgi:DNA-directed RNA polymerase subunit RPC12/RpoP
MAGWTVHCETCGQANHLTSLLAAAECFRCGARLRVPVISERML